MHFEFQRLHGMGEALHEAVRDAHGTRCRICAPVGAHHVCVDTTAAGGNASLLAEADT